MAAQARVPSSPSQVNSDLVKKLQADLQDAKKMWRESQEKLQSEQQTSSLRLSSLTNQLEAVKAQKESKEQQCHMLQQQLDVQTTTLSKVRADLRTASVASVELEKAKRNLEEMKTKLETSKEVSSLQSSMKDSDLLQERERKIRQLTAENCRIKARLAASQDLEEEVRQLQAKDSRSMVLKDELATLQASHAILQNKYQDWFQCMSQVVPDAKGPLDVLRVLQDLQNECMMLKTQQGQLQTSNKQAEIRLQLLQEKNDKTEASLRASENAIKNMKSSLDDCRLELEKARKQTESYKGFLDSYDAEASLQNHDQTRIARIAELEKSLSLAEAQVVEKTSLAEANERKAQELERHLQKVEAEAEAMQEKLGRGEFDPRTTKVLHLAMNPEKEAIKAHKQDQITQLTQENARLSQQLKDFQSGAATPVATSAVLEEKEKLLASKDKEIEQLKLAVQQTEKARERLNQVFRGKVREFREACYLLTGYKIEMKPIKNHSGFVLKSMYAERETDDLIFFDTGDGLQVY